MRRSRDSRNSRGACCAIVRSGLPSRNRNSLRDNGTSGARAKGARPLRVWLGHALRNALIPLVAVGGLQVGTLVAYTLLTETVFQWPGMGFLFLEAVTRSDIPLITTYLVAVGFLFVLVNTLVDIASLMLDPRISLEGTR